MRLFIAVDIPESVKERLRMVSCGLPGARWVSPDQFHLTLRFIGEVDGSVLREIHLALQDVRIPPLYIRLQGIGFFPPRGKPHTLWVGVAGAEQLLQLRNRIESALTGLGFEPEPRKFAPHVTLARLRNTPTAKLGRFIEQHGLFDTPEIQIDEFRLYRSVLSAKGAKHYLEQAYPLGK